LRSRTERIEAEPRGRRRSWAKSGATALLSAAALVSSGFLAATPAAATSHSTAVHFKRLCGETPRPGQATCFAEERTDIVHNSAAGASGTPSGYGPSDLQSAYNLPSGTAGSGQTVAVVDAYDDPNAQADLDTYRAQYGLPACDAGCFTKMNQRGGTTPPAQPPAGSTWTGEISLDLDMVSAICPQCHITLVEADSDMTTDLFPAESTAIATGAKFISNSWGLQEDPSETGVDGIFNHPGVVITASTGDNSYGYGVVYPAASPYVTAVGGTSLTRASNARGWSESVWSTDSTDGTGSGCSSYEPKATWQAGISCTHRMTADVSAVADPATGVAVYDGSDGGWLVFGGTSAASPIIAATYALAGTPAPGTNPASYPYNQTSALNDVTSGTTGPCSPSMYCTAGPGYDGPTGLGTPNGATAFAAVTTLASGQILKPGHNLSDGGLTLTMQTDGNLVAYLSTGGVGSQAVWASNTSGHPGAYAAMQSDGNLVVYTANGGPSTGGALWSTGTYGHSGAYATVQTDGNLVVYASTGGPSTGGALWATNVYDHAQTIASGTKLTGGWWTQGTYTRLVMQRDGNLVIYRNRDGAALWASNTSGHAGAYAVMQSDGNLVIYSSTNAVLWSSKTYGHSGAYAVMQNDGNFVIYAKAGGALWSTGTYKNAA
jgi:hypothetical protein